MLNKMSETLVFDSDVILNSNLEGIIGSYLLLNENSEVNYVGSTRDLERRIASHWRENAQKYKYFQFIECDTEKSAFLMECKLYHEYKPIDNLEHPKKQGYSPNLCAICAKIE